MQLAGGGTLATGLTLGAVPTPARAADEYDDLLVRLRDSLTGGPDLDLSDPSIRALVDELDADVTSAAASLTEPAGRTVLWADLPITGTPAQRSTAMTDTFGRLATMARAYATPASIHHGDAALAARIVEAMTWLNDTMYSLPAEYEVGSWYAFEVSTPNRISTALALLGDAVPAADLAALIAAIDFCTPDPTTLNYAGIEATGANLIWKCRTAVVDGLLTREPARITVATEAIATVFSYVTVGDGFYRDGSFIQHEAFPYAGAYGNSLVVTLLPMLSLLAGSSWDIDHPERGNINAWVHNSFAPFMVKGAIMDSVRGRNISNPTGSDHLAGHNVIEMVLQAAEFAPPADRAAFRSMVKTWVTEDTSLDHRALMPLPLLPLLDDILNDPTVAPYEQPQGFRGFGSMDRAVQHQATFSTGLAMSSSRIRNFESTSLNTNMHGWYTANGMLYVYNDDLDHYADDYWPTVDPYRLPGTTVDRVPRTDGAGRNYTSVDPAVGMVQLNGYGAAMMALQQDVRYGSDLEAKKSWFFTPDAVVALGADITATGPHTVETIIENRNLHDQTPTLTVDGVDQPLLPSPVTSVADARWAHLDGTGGYLFLDQPTVQVLREDRTGAWSDINVAGTDDPITRRYQTIWVDHGVGPEQDSYAYVVLPGASRARTAARADDSGIEVIANHPRAQGVELVDQRLAAVNFWAPGTVGPITLHPPSDPELPTLYFDDLDQGFTIVPDDWRVQTDDGDGPRWEGHESYYPKGDGSARARFAVEVPTTGWYEVSGWWREHSSHAIDTPFTVHHADGDTAVRVNQKWGGAIRWRRIGVFRFEAGKSHGVEVSNDANGTVIADAVRLAPVTADDRWAASVMLQRTGRDLRLAISDPTQLAGELTVSVVCPGAWSWTPQPGVTVVRERRGARITVDVAGAAGATRTVTLRG